MAHLTLQTGRYDAAIALLGDRRLHNDRLGIGHNTWLERSSPWHAGVPDSEPIGVTYHSTVIYWMRADGWVLPRFGGWNTVTTKQRVNALLPGPWAIYSRNGKPWLYGHGAPIVPFRDGIAVHVGRLSDGSDATGAVGYVADGRDAFGSVAELMTAEDVQAAVAVEESRQAARAAKRAARLMREHPSADVVPLHRTFDHRSWDCPRCAVMRERERLERQRALATEHRTGGHVDSNGWYGAETADSKRKVCPWDCPLRGQPYDATATADGWPADGSVSADAVDPGATDADSTADAVGTIAETGTVQA